jgi:hypothetical protein
MQGAEGTKSDFEELLFWILAGLTLNLSPGISSMRKYKACFLLIIILFHMGIFYPLFFLRKAEIKREVRHRILQGSQPQLLQEAVVLILSPLEFERLQWIEKGHEFLLHGKMFDIISVQKPLQGKIRILALEDGKEIALYQALKQRQDAIGGRMGLINLAMQLSLYFIPAAIRITPLPAKYLVFSGYRICPPLPFEPGVPSPPPWCTS